MPLQTPDEVLAVLAATPQRLAAAAEGVPDDVLHRAPAPSAWSARDVLAHLRACADVWGSCIAQILEQDVPTLRAVNPRTWIERTDHLQQDFGPSLRAFSAQRRDLLAVLEPLPPQAWERRAVVTGAGRELERTVLSYAAWLASHERPHVKQVERAARG